MTEWAPVPEPVTWTLPEAKSHGGVEYSTITIRAPTAEEVMKATAVAGASGMEITLRLIEAVSAEHFPYALLVKTPAWMVEQMSQYMELFTGAPAPDPLEAWRAARRAVPPTMEQPAS